MSRDNKYAMRRLGMDRRRFTQLLFASCSGVLAPSLATAQYQADLGRYNRAFAACMQWRGYVV